MHDDILFRTDNWGKRVLEHFEDERIGLIGVIGSHVMLDFPLPWWSYYAGCGKIIQGKTVDGNYISTEQSYTRTPNQNSEECAVVDGLWFCIRRSLFDKICFDEQSYGGFHCYDCDICMQVIHNQKQVRVVHDILIEHRSVGMTNDVFYKNLGIWRDKWHQMLPVVRGVCKTDFEMEELNENAKHILILESKCALMELKVRRYEILAHPLRSLSRCLKRFLNA